VGLELRRPAALGSVDELLVVGHRLVDVET